MDFTRLDEYLASLLAYGFPMFDCTVHVACREVYRRQGGYIDREKQRRHIPNTRYFLYSASKPVTCAAALTLLERGRFGLADPLDAYLPEFADVSVAEKHPDGTVTTRAPRTRITVRDLFTMSAGLNYNLGAPAIREAVAASGGRAPTREIVRAIAREPLSFDPGTRWQYSLCHDVLAALVEEVSGMRFSEYVRSAVFEPLGMEHSAYHLTEDILPDMAAQYRYNDKTHTAERVTLQNGYILGTEYESGGAGMISTAEDYIRFADAMANGGAGANGARILSPAAIDLMRAPALTAAQAESYNWSQLRGYNYGLGVRTLTDVSAAGSLAPAGEFGWGGAAGALTFFSPETRTAVYYAQHTLCPAEEKVLPQLRNVIFACLAR